MTYGSCRFLFYQFIQRDKAHKTIADADTLATFSVALVRCADVDRLDQIMGCIAVLHAGKHIAIFAVEVKLVNKFSSES